ncbi:MAG TPA: hypothetical protein VMW03_03450 [Candidatus Krumholzibacteriaceae bacterium]|nr:hypothetical protein [Candidatus Krumholzibacteriaceae bacterium]
MEDCEQLNLRRLEGNYLKFIVENHAELSLLEHVEKCITCREQIKKLAETGGHSPDFGNLFQREADDPVAPQFTDHSDPEDFIDARIKWRKNRLTHLNESAEAELEDLRRRISP